MAPHVNSYLTFQSWAFQINSQGKHNQRQFNVLCGENQPTIIDGYGKWAVIDRPLRQGITIPQGFNPAKLKVDVIFGIWNRQFGFSGWDTRAEAANQVESNIDDLHWMAGGNALGGPSPVVYVDSWDMVHGTPARTRLIPKPYWGVPWVITEGIQWGKALRNPNGDRIYQEASLTLLGYTPAAGENAAPPEQTRLGGGYFKTNHQIHTARGIASANSSRSPTSFVESLARNICASPRNNPCKGSRIKLERRSIDWSIPVNTEVWVPAHPI